MADEAPAAAPATVSSTTSVTSNRDAWASVIVLVIDAVVKLVLALAIVAINAIVLYLVLTKTMPEANKDLVIAIVNGTGMAQGLALGYYFGASAAKGLPKGP